MWKGIRYLVLLVLLGVAGYLMLSYHIIYFGKSFKFLKKSRFTSEYTFIWASNKSVESLMRIDTLREAGLGKVLVEMGRLSKEKQQYFEQKFDSDPIYY